MVSTRELLHEFLKTATCEEVETMIGDKYIRCGRPTIAIVKHVGRNEGPYALCYPCASHNIRNRGAALVLACSDVGLDQIREMEEPKHNHELRKALKAENLAVYQCGCVNDARYPRCLLHDSPKDPTKTAGGQNGSQRRYGTLEGND